MRIKVANMFTFYIFIHLQGNVQTVIVHDILRKTRRVYCNLSKNIREHLFLKIQKYRNVHYCVEQQQISFPPSSRPSITYMIVHLCSHSTYAPTR